MVDYTVALDSLLKTASGLPFFLGFLSSLFFENKKSPVILVLLDSDFLMYPSISAPSSVLRLVENSISPLTTPVLPIITLSAEIFPSSSAF